MALVRFVEHDGTEHVVEVAIGENLKQAALDNLIPGIIGDCGGCATCGTCHGYIERSFLHQLPPMDEDEEFALEGVPADVEDNSRLTCQIIMTDALAGIEVRLPDVQG